MTPSQRLALLLAAVVVLAAGAVVALGSGDDESEQSGTTTTQPAQTTETSTGTGGATAPAETQPAQAQPAPPRVETVRIADGGPAGEPRTLRFKSGQTVRLRFRSNTAAEVHIHGYDKLVNVPAGGSARVTFKATAEGIFEIEEHHSGKLLAKLEVRP